MTERQQKLHALALELFAKFRACNGWTFRVIPGLKSLGICNYNAREIGIQESYAEVESWDKVEDTLRHEVAHILAGANTGHGPVWKMFARAVGANPEASKDAAAMSYEYIRSVYKYQMIVVYDDGEVEYLKLYGKRKTNLAGKFVVGRRETKDKLQWVKL